MNIRTAGIIKSIIKDTQSEIRECENHRLVELSSSSNSFTALIDESCLGINTKNPKATLSEVKWLMIRKHVWEEFKTAYPNIRGQDFFNILCREEGNSRILNGNSVTITKNTIINNSEDGNEGVIYLLMPYNHYPELESPANIQVVALGTPRVLYCLFKFSENSSSPLEEKEKKVQYGETVEVEIYTHLLPDPHETLDKFVFDVSLINREKEVLKIEKQQLLFSNPYAYNSHKILKLQINPEWQKSHQNKKECEKYHLKLKGYMSFIGTSLTSPDHKIDFIEYSSENNKENWYQQRGTQRIYNTSNELLVPYNQFYDSISSIEREKSNQIQYVGDIDYHYREFDPCGYTTISIHELDNENRPSPYIIFEEGKTKPDTVEDISDRFYEIVSNEDQSKQVAIIVEGLQIEGVKCDGVLLDEGQKHSDLHNVFQTEKIWTAKIPEREQIIDLSRDFPNQDQIKEENKNQIKRDKLIVSTPKPIPIVLKPKKIMSNYKDQGVLYEKDQSHTGNTGALKNDYDLQKSYKIEGASVQGWIEGKDFTITHSQQKATFTLKTLHYVYNKTFPTFLGENTAIGNYLWMFNYFWLSKENLEQIYFLPVSTCRYPNQLAKIKVYPDISWELTLELGSGTPETYSHTNLPSGDYFKREQKKALEAANNKRWLNKEVFFDLLIKAKTGALEREISIGYEQKIKSILKTLITIKETLDDISGLSEVNREKAKARKIAALLKIKSPFILKIEYPQIAIQGKWKLEPVKNKAYVARTGSISFGFTPLIKGTGKLDLITMAEYLPVAGPIFKAINTVKDAINAYTGVTADIWIYLYAFGQIDLRGNIEVQEKNTDVALQSDTTVGIGVELGVKAKAELPKISFGANTKSIDIGAEFEISAKGETSLIFKGNAGADNEGMYLEMQVDFGGLTVYVTAKMEINASLFEFGVGTTDVPYTLIDPVPNILGKKEKARFYLIKSS